MILDPDITAIEAPLNANVWKVEVKVGDKLKNEQIVAVLEAMKLEIPVKAELEGGVVEKVLVKPNDVVEAGRPLILLRKPRR
jgi:urea carboxylase